MKRQSTTSLYWKCQIIGWSIAALYWGLMGYVGPGFSWLLALLHFVTDVLICISVTHVYRAVSKKYKWHTLGFKDLLIRIVPAVFLLSAVYMVIAIVKLYLVHINFRVDFSQSFRQYYYFNATNVFIGGIRYMSIWLLAYYLYHYAQREIKIISENTRLNLVAKEAQLNNLSAQLNPHFLFNSLNSIKSLVVESPDESRRAIDLLSDLLRKSLYERNSMLISIKDELAIVNDYLELEKMRFEERLQFVIQVPEKLLSSLIIPFSIQTLVDNAVKHGINRASQGGTICIKVASVDSTICITVESPGVLNKRSPNHGIGLSNLQERLSLQFHDKGSFSIHQHNNETVMATIMIPAA